MILPIDLRWGGGSRLFRRLMEGCRRTGVGLCRVPPPHPGGAPPPQRPSQGGLLEVGAVRQTPIQPPPAA